jgi:recombinase
MARIANERAADIAPVIAELWQAGAKSLNAIADGLNERGIPTARGGHWSATQVARVLARIDSE